MLQELKENFEKLISLYETEKGKNKALTSRLAESEATCETYRKQIIELEHQVDNLKLTDAFMAPGNNSSDAAKEKIEKLIKEIDKCISLMEK